MKTKCPHEEGEDILAVDQYRLDSEWVRQSRIYNYYAERAADAKREADEAKSKLALIEAKLRLAIVSSPDEYGLAKTTEKVVDAAIVVQPECIDAARDMRDARYNADCIASLLTALDHKKKALENLVSLQARDYFSEPKARGEARDVAESAKRDTPASRLKKRTRKLS